MTYALSDIHGCFDKYRAMLQEIDFCDRDTLYVLGDVIDRGPDGVMILQDMSLRPNVFPLLGNHELTAALCLPWLMQEITDQSIDALQESQVAALSDWLVNGGEPTLRALKALDREAREDILEYLHEMALYAEVTAGGRAFVLTHAAPEHFSPARALDDYDLQDFLFGRPQPEAVYYPDKTLVFGHTPTRLFGGGDNILRQKSWIDIDCGCVFKGGRLGCLCLDTLEEFYV